MSQWRVAVTVAALGAFSLNSAAQSVTGQISGTVTDPTGAAVIGATVKLTHQLSGQSRNSQTDAGGSFIFTNLVPGDYNVRIEMAGFRAYDQRGIRVSAQERIDLHEIRLELGEVTTTVEVQASGVYVATTSSDRTVSMGIQEIENRLTRGRNALALIQGLPGVQSVGGYDFRGWGGGGIPAVNGGRSGQVILNLDGAASQDSGNLNPGYLSPNIESIAEVKLLVSNYTAEYGGRTGGQLLLTTKNGTREFHGSAYYYWRHESLNANEFFNNKLLVAKPRYRFQNPGGSLGGPLVLPGTQFNRDRTKLFFFFAYDRIRSKSLITNTFTMPSARERQGDFSETVTTRGALIPIFDATTRAPFPGNRIPASRIHPAGRAMLDLFPLPDPKGLALDPTGLRRYNFLVQLPQSRPNESKTLRLDYNVGSKLTTFVRLLQSYEAVDGYAGTVGPNGGAWGQFPHSYHVNAAGAVATAVYTLSPTLVNEFTYGINRGRQGVDPLDEIASPASGGAKTYADSLLPLKDAGGQPVALPRMFSPATNSLKLLPRVSFGFPAGFTPQSAGQTISQAPTFGHDSRWPFVGTDSVHSFSNKITWVKGAHTVKAGIYVERMARNVSVYSVFGTAGTFYFGSDRAASLDTGYPYSNALLGAIFAYGEDNKKQVNHARYLQLEWFAQDTWRVNRRLTLDLGLRFHRVGDLYSEGATLGFFRKEDYDASKAGQLLYPAVVGGQRVAINPVTGKVFPYVRQGTFDTASYAPGSYPWSGIREYNSHFFEPSGVLLGPRVGFAVDLFGNGKTALRGGGGITIGRNWTVDNIGALGAGTGPMAAPPNFLAPVILYTNFENLGAAEAYYTPQNVLGGPQRQEIQTAYNWSFGIQHDMGWGMIADVSYVGNALRHGYGLTYDLNAVPPYTTWNPRDGAIERFRDPTTARGFYSANLIRAMVGYRGFGQIPLWTYVGTSSYHALQAQLNRRFGKLQWGANYTWSRTTIYDVGNVGAGNFTQWIDARLTKTVVNRPHAFNLNFGYDVPKLGAVWRHALARFIFDGWRVNGFGAIYSGTPFTVNCQAQAAPPGYWTGTPTGGIPFRCQMGSNILLPEGQYPSRSEDPKLQYRLNAANFRLPPAESLGIGNTPPALFYGPGLINLDLAVSKEFPLAKEGLPSLELKLEMFNALNHFNPSNPNTTLVYDFNSGAQTNSNFGVISSAQVQARRMVLSARIEF